MPATTIRRVSKRASQLPNASSLTAPSGGCPAPSRSLRSPGTGRTACSSITKR